MPVSSVPAQPRSHRPTEHRDPSLSSLRHGGSRSLQGRSALCWDCGPGMSRTTHLPSGDHEIARQESLSSETSPHPSSKESIVVFKMCEVGALTSVFCGSLIQAIKSPCFLHKHIFFAKCKYITFTFCSIEPNPVPDFLEDKAVHWFV